MLRGFRPRVQTGPQKPTEGQVSFHGHGRDLWPMSVARRRDGFGSALDVSVRALVLNLLVDLRERRRLGMVFISHYIQTVRRLADRLRVRCVGRIVEVAGARAPRHCPPRPQEAVQEAQCRHRRGRDQPLETTPGGRRPLRQTRLRLPRHCDSGRHRHLATNTIGRKS